jgi:diguanylate cyclase (GGDEF)-like protein
MTVEREEIHDAEESHGVGRANAGRDLLRRALHDALTGVPGALLLEDRVDQAIIAAHRDNSCLALILIRLDWLDEIREAMGPEAANGMLLKVSERLHRTVRESDTIARLRDDAFAVLLPCTDDLGALLVTRKIFLALEQPYDLKGHEVAGRPRIGAALYPQHGKDFASLCHTAATAAEDAGRCSSGYVVFGAGQESLRPRPPALADDLQQAIETGELLLAYQPKIDLQSQSAPTVEALVYWEHPRHGFMPPDQFIPLAEQTGLIRPLTLWVVNEALRQCRAWLVAGLRMGVAVNLSAHNLRDPQLVSALEAALQNGEVSPSLLELEIAESAIMADPVRVARVMTRLHELGVRIAIDDFGTGYSSLPHLVELPVDEVKIDRRFVADMLVNRNDALIVRAIVQLAHTLGLRVVAKGVETQAALTDLADMGCDLIQGYVLAGPLAADDVPRWLFDSPYRLRQSEALQA